MGCVQPQETINLSPLPTKSNTLKVFSLNFCGILKSPFEFYSSKSIEMGQQLSSNFKKLLQDHFKELPLDKLSKMIGSIDKKTKDFRYSPLYKISAGIQGNKFVSKERFTELWRSSFVKNTENISQQLLQFDLLIFQCLLQHVYKISGLEEAADRDPAAYLQLYEPLFAQSFLDKQGQIAKLKKSINSDSFDILFIQQASAKLIDFFKEDGRFYVSTSEDQDTLILANKESFQELKDIHQLSKQFTDQEWRALNWNGHTSIMLVDHYALVCGHLASKKAENQKNVKDLKEALPRLKEKFPNYEIICGCDCNAYVPQISSNFNIYPTANDQFTTVKKRTWLQVQFSKADVVSQETKDHIFSTLNLISGQVLLINGALATKQTYLPLDQHPYDHFLVKAQIQRQSN